MTMVKLLKPVCAFMLVFALILMAIPYLDNFNNDPVPIETTEVQEDDGMQIEILGEGDGSEPIPAQMECPPGKPSIPIQPPMKTRGKWNEVYNESFEFATWSTGWTINDQDANSGNDYWERDQTNPLNGNWALNCSAGPTAQPHGNGVGYDNDMDAWARWGPFDMRGTLGGSFGFWLNLSCEQNGQWDRFFYGVNVWPDDGNTYYGFVLQGNLTWRYITVDLSKYTTSPVRSAVGKAYVNISLVFESNSTICGDVGYKGAMIDDLVIMNYTSVPPTKPINLGVHAAHVRRVAEQEPRLLWEFQDPDGTTWEAQSGYHIQVSDDNDFSDIGTDRMWEHNETNANFGKFERAIYNSTNNASGMEDSKTYYFRVKTRDTDGYWGPFSDIFEFTHNDNPSIPTITNPTGTPIYTGSDNVQVDWTISTNPDDYTPPAIDTITVNLSYATTFAGPYTNIVSGETNDGTYNPWVIPSTVESPTCYLRVTAWDGYEETHAYFGPFAIDNYAPTINSINVTSDKPHVYAESLSLASATVWYNSLTAMGDGQKITVEVNWTDATKTSIDGNAVFDGAQSGAAPYNKLTYTVSTADNMDQTMTITVEDFFTKTDTVDIDFKIDNTQPTAPITAACHADIQGDNLGYDDDMEFSVTWDNGTDAHSGINHSLIGLQDPPDIPKLNNSHNFTAPAKNATVTVYIAMVDRVGNVGPLMNDTIAIDYGIPPPPVITSATHPDENLWYANKNPTFSWLPPGDLSGIAGYSLIFDSSPTTDTPLAISDLANSTNPTWAKVIGTCMPGPKTMSATGATPPTSGSRWTQLPPRSRTEPRTWDSLEWTWCSPSKLWTSPAELTTVRHSFTGNMQASRITKRSPCPSTVSPSVSHIPFRTT
jgi:hypothetical protein